MYEVVCSMRWKETPGLFTLLYPTIQDSHARGQLVLVPVLVLGRDDL